jgi:hypothetical protein
MNDPHGFSVWMQSHMVLASTLIYALVALIIAALILGRWYFSRNAWPFHPGGSAGFLKDEFLRLGAIFIPYVIVMLIYRFYVYDMHPELIRSPYTWLILLSVILFRRASVFIPFVRSAGKRLDAARKMAREATFSA